MPTPARALSRRLLLTLATSAVSVPGLAQNEVPAFPREARAVWVSTVGNIDWPSRNNLTTAQQQAEAITILDRAVRMNLNMIVLQVRPAADAIYPSVFEPWSPYLTGLMGRAPSPVYDPLKFWVDEAHARGLELHAWFNPYRALTSTSIGTSANHISQTNPSYVKTYGTALWMDPGERWIQNRTTSVIVDVVTRYDIDGVHFDDYFYPYPISGNAFPDTTSFSSYQASGGTMALADWRRDNVNKLVAQVNRAIKVRKPWVKFGIAPFGIWRPGNPAGITGLDAYSSLYADSRKWIREGMVDYLSPQLYWKIASTGQSYPKLLDWWNGQNLLGRHVWPGNFTSNIGPQFGDWPAEEILDQIDVTRSRPASTGNVHFSMRAFTGNYKGISDSLTTGAYTAPALIPTSPWLDNIAPAAPVIVATQTLPGNVTGVSWENRATEPVRRYAVWARYGVSWAFRIVSAPALSVQLPSSNINGTLVEVAVAAVDRSSNQSVLAKVAISGAPSLGSGLPSGAGPVINPG